MAQSFVIMQIGNKDMDGVYSNVIEPAIRACGLDPKRVDKHNEGRLLKSEIVKYIQDSEIIIADLTNERPNCYLEVGYAMGLDKYRNLILTAREDHYYGSPNYKKNGPRIHFDLSGYDILFWHPDDLKSFQSELEKRIRRRLATLVTTGSQAIATWDEEWITKHQTASSEGIKNVGLTGSMEIRMMLPYIKIDILQSELLTAATVAKIPTFGWPIGIVMNRESLSPKPYTDGIVAELTFKDRPSYDYWTLRKNGSFYCVQSYWEDTQEQKVLYFNTRIIRVTETLLYAVRLYTSLKVQTDEKVRIGIEHCGLKGRVLSATSNRQLSDRYISREDRTYGEIEVTLEEIERNLLELVEHFTKPLFTLFDFMKFEKDVVSDIVNRFVRGEVS